MTSFSGWGVLGGGPIHFAEGAAWAQVLSPVLSFRASPRPILGFSGQPGTQWASELS